MSRNNEREFVISLPKQPKCKSEQMSIHNLKNGYVTVIIITSLLFCLLLVLSEMIVTSLLGHVACHFYPLEGLYYNTSEEKRYILCNTQNSFLVHWSWLILN